MSALKLFIRNLWRNKLYSVVTVLGFGMALMFVILLSTYIRQEFSVDEFHVNKDRIYRAVSGQGSYFGPLIGEQLKNKYPEIECYTRVYENAILIDNDKQEKIIGQVMLVDSTFFKMFSFSLLDGNAAELLTTHNRVVLTRAYALKIFGKEDVVGETLINEGRSLIVSGVVEDIPDNTHFNRADMFLRFDYLGILWEGYNVLQSNNNSSFALYVMARPGTNLKSKEELILEDFKKDYSMYVGGFQKEFSFEFLTAVYWGGKSGSGAHGNNKTFVFILMAIVLSILFLALINYNNLSMARVGFRAKEAAVKKLVGITNGALFRQFVTESIALCFLAFFIAVGFAYLARPLFNEVLGANIDLSHQLTWEVVITVLLAIGGLGFISGAVPAMAIIRFNPIDVVKGVFRREVRGTYGKILICFQYTVSIVLIICTLVIIRQTDYLKNYNLGFDKENVIWLQSNISFSQKEALRNEFMSLPGVRYVSFVQGSPMDGGNNSSFENNGRPVSFQVFKVDSFFFKIMDIPVRSTSVAMSPEGVYLNETGVKELGLEDTPTKFNMYDSDVPVLGIVKDFHFRHLTEKVGPAMIMPLTDDSPWKILVKIDGYNAAETYRNVTKTYSQFIGGIPVEGGFMDDTINQWYAPNERQARLIGYFAVVAVILAMMGILAMATYYISQRMKEIGIRRVNGATVYEVLSILIRSFMKWVGVAFVLACPLAWYVMNSWLEAYPYRVSMGWWLFLLVGIGISIVALVMISWQSIKAAIANPVKSLKNE